MNNWLLGRKEIVVVLWLVGVFFLLPAKASSSQLSPSEQLDDFMKQASQVLSSVLNLSRQIDEIKSRQENWESDIKSSFSAMKLGVRYEKGTIGALNDLNRQSIANMQLIGVVNTHNASMAIIRTRAHQLYFARVGDLIGSEFLMLRKIGDDFVELSEDLGGEYGALLWEADKPFIP